MNTTFLLKGAQAAASHFGGGSYDKGRLRTVADALRSRANWKWDRDGVITATLRWNREGDFRSCRWEGYEKALPPYGLAPGSSTWSLPAKSFTGWLTTARREYCYRKDYFYTGSPFTNQLSRFSFDFSGIQSARARGKGIDCLGNSRRATFTPKSDAIENPLGFKSYGGSSRGMPANESPGPCCITVDGNDLEVLDYGARGMPYGPDDGTPAEWAVPTPLAFAPEIVLPTNECGICQTKLTQYISYGFKTSFNPSHTELGP